MYLKATLYFIFSPALRNYLFFYMMRERRVWSLRAVYYVRVEESRSIYLQNFAYNCTIDTIAQRPYTLDECYCSRT